MQFSLSNVVNTVVNAVASVLSKSVYEYIVAASFVPADNSSDWKGYTLRVVVDNSVLSGSGTKIRVTIVADTDQGCEIAKAYVGIQASSGNAWDFEDAPTQLTFNGGSASVTIPVSDEVVSDEVDLIVNEGDSLVLSLYVDTGASEDDLLGKISESGWTSYQKNADDAATVAPSGFSLTTRDATAFRLIELGALA